jgi:single-stranded-DNA-specific exonuclease
MNITNGAKMLIKHIFQGDDVLIQIDSDCDGYTSSALLINYLNCLFPAFVRNHIYYRVHDGKQHGIILNTIPKEVKLVIAPDSSSNDYKEHEILHQQNVDVLVIDHHEAEKISDYACVINNQLCDYPTKSLSGVGMVYKFCSYLDELLNVDYSNSFLDLVALGMIADMMDLKDYETKHLITCGLENIYNPFFKGMVKTQEYSLKNNVDIMGVAFYIAPYINAVVRMGTQEEKLTLFESMLDFKGYELIPSTKRGCSGQKETRVEQACRICVNVKNKQTKARDSALEEIKTLIKENNLLQNKVLIVKLDSLNINKNLTGLIANQLMAEYQRPVLLLNKGVYTPENGQPINCWEGSGRGYDKSELSDFRGLLADSQLVIFAEGHANAFGICIADDKLNLLIDYLNNTLADFDFSACYKVDFIFSENDFKGSDIIEIANYKSLWGQGITEPMIALERIIVHKDNLTLMSPTQKPTLKIILPNKTELIKFKSSQEEFDKLFAEYGCVILNAVGVCKSNSWGGRITPQIEIKDYEIVDRQNYYF